MNIHHPQYSHYAVAAHSPDTQKCPVSSTLSSQSATYPFATTSSPSALVADQSHPHHPPYQWEYVAVSGGTATSPSGSSIDTPVNDATPYFPYIAGEHASDTYPPEHPARTNEWHLSHLHAHHYPPAQPVMQPKSSLHGALGDHPIHGYDLGHQAPQSQLPPQPADFGLGNGVGIGADSAASALHYPSHVPALYHAPRAPAAGFHEQPQSQLQSHHPQEFSTVTVSYTVNVSTSCSTQHNTPLAHPPPQPPTLPQAQRAQCLHSLAHTHAHGSHQPMSVTRSQPTQSHLHVHPHPHPAPAMSVQIPHQDAQQQTVYLTQLSQQRQQPQPRQHHDFHLQHCSRIPQQQQQHHREYQIDDHQQRQRQHQTRSHLQSIPHSQPPPAIHHIHHIHHYQHPPETENQHRYLGARENGHHAYQSSVRDSAPLPSAQAGVNAPPLAMEAAAADPLPLFHPKPVHPLPEWTKQADVDIDTALVQDTIALSGVPDGQYGPPVPHATIEEIEDEGEHDEEEDEEEEEDEIMVVCDEDMEQDPTLSHSFTTPGTLSASSLLCQPVSDAVRAQFAPQHSVATPMSSSFAIPAPVLWS